MSYRLSVTVCVIREDGKLLCVTNRRFGGFSFPGGKVEEGESFEEAAARELLEETGCEPISLTKIAASDYGNLSRDPNEIPWICMGFTAVIGDQTPSTVEEGTEPFWATPDEVVAGGLYSGWYEWFFDIVGIPYG